MKKQDKFEEYLRKEMESIQYDGEDRMWNGFKTFVPAPTFLEQVVSWSIPLAVVGAMGLGIYFYAGSGVIKDNLVGKNESQRLEKLDIPAVDQQHVVNIEEVAKSNEEEAKSIKEGEVNIEEVLETKTNTKDELTLESRNSNLIPKKTKSKIISATLEDSKQFPKERRSQSQFAETVIDNQSELISEFNGRKLQQPRVANQKSQLTDNTTTTTDQSNTLERGSLSSLSGHISGHTLNQPQRRAISLLEFVERRKSLLSKEATTNEMTLAQADIDSRLNFKLAGFVGVATSSTGLQTFSTGLNYWKSVSERVDLQISIGGQYEIGNIVSQDSIIKTVNVSISETRKDKDLNDLASLYLTAVPLYKFGQLSLGIGPKLSYGVYNRFNIVESTNGINNEEFNRYNFPFPQESVITQDWTSINRLRFGGELVLGYQTRSRFGLQLRLSKNFNKLIKDDLAVTDRSNSPVTIGLQLNYSIKY